MSALTSTSFDPAELADSIVNGNLADARQAVRLLNAEQTLLLLDALRMLVGSYSDAAQRIRQLTGAS